jgi:two-component system nitrogen regulation response regulator NtrX
MNNILVVDDEKNIRETLKDVLEDEGYEVYLAEDGKKAVEALVKRTYDVMLLDLWLPEIGGMEVLKIVREEYNDIQVIIISGHGTIDTAVKATKIGAFDFIEKPLSLTRVLRIIDHAINISGLKSENVELKARNQRNYFMVRGASKLFADLEAIIESCAESNSRILITGENGTGKEVIARKIHEKSKRKNESFVAVNCAAIPQTLIEPELFGYEKGAFTGAVKNKIGKFELAHMLRVLEELQFERVGGVSPIKIDVRVIAATNKDIEEQISKGWFREDLYYRLNVVPVHLSPLRDRTEDIPPLIEYYLDYFARENNKKRKFIKEDAFQFLTEVYNWPGNIRELKNLIERLSILTRHDTITLKDVKPHIPRLVENFSINNSLNLKDAKENFEKAFISTALRENGYNISRAAETLKVGRSNLYKLIKRLGIDLSR